MPLTPFRISESAPRVLVAEDDPHLREAICDLLDGQGFRAEGAADGREALETLRKNPATDLLVLDLMMPTMSGWELRETLREDPALGKIPVLVLSALVEDGVDRPFEGHPEFHLGKPFNAEMLLACVRRAIGDPREPPTNRIYENLTARVSTDEAFVEFRADEDDRVPLFRLGIARFEDRVLRMMRNGGVRADLGHADEEGLRLLTLSHAWGGGVIALQHERVPLTGES
jgi:CheY-like chemotaxis protein